MCKEQDGCVLTIEDYSLRRSVKNVYQEGQDMASVPK
jgi:hypothetical protein